MAEVSNQNSQDYQALYQNVASGENQVTSAVSSSAQNISANSQVNPVLVQGSLAFIAAEQTAGAAGQLATGDTSSADSSTDEIPPSLLALLSSNPPPTDAAVNAQVIQVLKNAPPDTQVATFLQLVNSGTLSIPQKMNMLNALSQSNIIQDPQMQPLMATLSSQAVVSTVESLMGQAPVTPTTPQSSNPVLPPPTVNSSQPIRGWLDTGLLVVFFSVMMQIAIAIQQQQNMERQFTFSQSQLLLEEGVENYNSVLQSGLDQAAATTAEAWGSIASAAIGFASLGVGMGSNDEGAAEDDPRVKSINSKMDDLAASNRAPEEPNELFEQDGINPENIAAEGEASQAEKGFPAEFSPEPPDLDPSSPEYKAQEEKFNADKAEYDKLDAQKQKVVHDIRHERFEKRNMMTQSGMQLAGGIGKLVSAGYLADKAVQDANHTLFEMGVQMTQQAIQNARSDYSSLADLLNQVVQAEQTYSNERTQFFQA